MTPQRLRRSRLLAPATDGAPRRDRDARLFIVAVEGKEDEPRYFDWLQHAGLINARRVKVHVLPPERGDSAPSNVLERLQRFRQSYTPEPNDSFWLVSDVDDHGEGKLAAAARGVHQAGFDMAVSRPCFQVWLLLHEGDLPDEAYTIPEGREAPGQFKKLWNQVAHRYAQPNPNRPFPTLDWITLDHLRAAIARAQALDQEPSARWPTTLGSHLYRLFNAIEAAGG